MDIKKINELDFDEEILDYSGIAVVKFYGTWCGPCKMIKSIISDMPDMEGLKMTEVDVDKSLTLAKQFGVMSVPTLIIFKDGAEVDKIVGFRNQSQLLEIFDRYLSSGK